MALAAVRRIDALFEIERAINGQSPAERLAVRQQLGVPRVAELENWMRAERAKLSRHNDVAKAHTGASVPDAHSIHLDPEIKAGTSAPIISYRLPT